MTLKVRDHLRLPSSVILTVYPRGLCEGQGTSSALQYQTRCTGQFKSIDSEYSGKFVPGVFRVNPVTIVRGEGRITNGTLRACYYYSPELMVGPLIASSPRCSTYYGSWKTNLADFALQKAYAKLNDADVELGVILGELRDTLRMLKDPLEALNNFGYKAFGAPGRAGFTLTAALWLQYRYGLRPLFNDIMAACKAVYAKLHEQHGIIRRRKAEVVKTYDYSFTERTTMGSFSYSAVKSHSETVKATAHVYYRVKYDKSALALWGLGENHFNTIAWELMSYSFVVDWFLSVGNWLKGLSLPPRLEYIGNCVSQKITSDVKLSMTTPTYQTGGAAIVEFEPSDFTWISEKLVRQVNLLAPALPAFNPRALDYLQVLDSIGLIWSGFKLGR